MTIKIKYLIAALLLPLLVWGAEITIQNSTNIEDIQLNSAEPDASYPNATTLGTSDTKRFLVGLKDLDDVIGATSLVTACSLGVYAEYIDAITVSAYEVYRNAVEAEACWNKYKTDSTWETAGCEGTTYDRSADAMDSFTRTSQDIFYYVSLDTAFVNYIIRNDVERWVLLKKTAGAGNDSYYYSSEYSGDPTKCPKLYITYTPQAPATPTRTEPDSAATAVVPDSCRFQYSSASADSYEVWCAIDEGFESIIFDSILAATQIRYNLSTFSTYYWKIAAKNEAGWSDTSTIWPFTTGDNIPSSSCYYVAPDGDNGNSGTYWEPWATINYAVEGSSALSRGDTVYIRDGYYRNDGDITPNIAESGSDSICVMNYPGEIVHSPEWHFNYNMDYWYLRGMKIDSMNGDGVLRLQGADHITIDSCTFIYNQYSAIRMYKNAGTDSTCNNITIHACSLISNGVSETGDRADVIIFVDSANGLNITRNWITMNTGKGVTFAAAFAQYSENCRIDSNWVINTRESGLDLRGLINSVVSWNYVSLNGIRDPEEGDFGDKGMLFSPNNVNCVIHHNVLKSNGAEQLLYRADKCSVLNNLIKVDSVFALWPDTTYYAYGGLGIFDNMEFDSSYFFNNIFMSTRADSNKHYIFLIEDYNDYAAQFWDYNCFWGTEPEYTPPYHFRFSANNPWGQAVVPFDSIQSEGFEAHGFWADP